MFMVIHNSCFSWWESCSCHGHYVWAGNNCRAIMLVYRSSVPICVQV